MGEVGLHGEGVGEGDDARRGRAKTWRPKHAAHQHRPGPGAGGDGGEEEHRPGGMGFAWTTLILVRGEMWKRVSQATCDRSWRNAALRRFGARSMSRFMSCARRVPSTRSKDHARTLRTSTS